MKLKQIIQELSLPLTTKTPIGKKLKQYRGINYIVLGENEPPDVHGIPKALEAYGRGWLNPNNAIEIDGGPQGSAQGHPTRASQGFYWGADYDKAWRSPDGEQHTGVIYVRGRAGTNEGWIKQNVYPILNMIFNRLPRP